MKLITGISLLLSAFLLCVQDLEAKQPYMSRMVQKIVSKEPVFSDIVKAYLKREGLENDYLKSWQKRIKIAPMLPKLYAGYDHSFKESQGHSVTDNISVSSGTVTIGPEDNDYDFDSDLGRVIRVRAVWNLNELIFNRNYFSLSKERRDVAKTRYVLIQNLFTIYRDRHQYLVEYFKYRRSSKLRATESFEHYILLTERLNSLTGGVFENMWWDGQRRSK